MNLLDQEIIYKVIDTENMFGDLANFPEHAAESVDFIQNSNVPSLTNINSIIYSGMGGSGISGNLLSTYISNKIHTPFTIVKGYTAPNYTNNNSLVLCVSYSGNTEETLSVYEQAKLAGANIAVITSGGKLQHLAVQNNDLLIMIPSGLQPRVATGYLFFSNLILLNKLGIFNLDYQDVEDTIKMLRKMRDEELSPTILSDTNIAKEIASDLKDKLAIIYGTEFSSAVATRWKTQLNEMAKHMAYTGTYPEINHNELVGFGFPENVANDSVIVSLRSSNDHDRVKLRQQFVEEELISHDVHQIIQVDAWGKTELQHLLSLMYIGDYTATYLAILNSINPADITKMHVLKHKLNAQE